VKPRTREAGANTVCCEDSRTGHSLGPTIRLGPADIERLIAAYADGNSVFRLAARFNIHRTTVLAHLGRNGVPRRRMGPKLSDADVDEAAILYRDGLSLELIGHRFLVAPDTVAWALRHVPECSVVGCATNRRRGFAQAPR